MVGTVRAHMCAFGMAATRDNGEVGPAMKPIKFMSNSVALLRELDRQCPGCESHVHLLSGRAAAAAVYPKQLCLAVCRGVRAQLELDHSDLFDVSMTKDCVWGEWC